MAEWHLVLNHIIGFLFPLASLLVLHSVATDAVKIDLTKVVEQSHQSNALIRSTVNHMTGHAILPNLFILIPIQ